jgi:replicative DNA helicase
MKQRKASQQEVKDILFSPNDAVKYALQTIEERRSTVGVGVRLGIRSVDDYMLPARPGELISVIGMTSNYKSGLMQFWSRNSAETIRNEQGLDQCVVYVTWEQAIEEMLAFDMASAAMLSVTDIMQGKISDEQLEQMRSAGMRRSALPLFLIGHSIAEGKKRPRLTLTTIGQALALIRAEFNLKPRAIFLDYLQQIEPEEGEDRRMQVFYNVYRCKDMALAMACPVILATQARREVYQATWGVPGLADSLESSNLEHTSDKMLGVWLPKTKFETGKRLEPEGYNGTLEVTENLLILKMLKQKMGPAGRWWPLFVDPSKNMIAEMAHNEPPF